MRAVMLAGVALLGLVSTQPAPAASVTTEPSITAVDRDQVARRGVIGKAVIDANGDSVGTVEDVLMDASGKTGATAVIRAGGFLGNGEMLVAVPLTDLMPGKDGRTIRVDGLTRQQVREMKLAGSQSRVAGSEAVEAAPPALASPADLEPRLLIGHEVVDVDGRKIGTVDNVVMNDGGDRPTLAIIKSGGFLGLGAKLIAVDFASLHAAPNRTDNVLSPGVLVASGLTQQQVRKMEDFRYAPTMRTYRPSGL